jgi:alcohol dehydrogenase
VKLIQIKRYGSSDVMEVNNTGSIPNPPQEKILVNIKASGVNPVDWKIREGHLQQVFPLQFPSTLGMDFSGVIKLLGENVPSDLKQGDEVYGQASVFSGGSGAFAELALTNPDSIAHKPKTLNHLEAAALPFVGVTAWQAIVEFIGLSKSQKILIHGGAGGIGPIAIQLAKHLGAYVATTVSTNDKRLVQELGADQVIDYKKENFEDMIHDYDATLILLGMILTKGLLRFEEK